MDIRGFEVVSAFEEQDINLPTRKTTESAGYDIECAEAVTLEPGQVVLVPTGIKAFMAYDEYLAIHIRSSMAIKRVTLPRYTSPTSTSLVRLVMIS